MNNELFIKPVSILPEALLILTVFLLIAPGWWQLNGFFRQTPADGFRLLATRGNGNRRNRNKGNGFGPTLAELVRYIHEQKYPIRSMMVIRDGYIVTEANFHPYEKGAPHIVHSCTKSIVSALIGIAIDKGFIKDENQNILELFPEYSPENLNRSKKSMTLKHLLTMSTGFNARDSYLYGWSGLEKYATQQRLDKVRSRSAHGIVSRFGFRLQQQRFLFAGSNPAKNARDKKALDFADKHLFAPLGISVDNIQWPQNPQGIVTGWGEIRMRPEDAAKLGLLYLQKGKWNGKQVISEKWIDKVHTETGPRRHKHRTLRFPVVDR